MLIERSAGRRSMIAKLWSLVAALAVVGSSSAGATPPARPIRGTNKGTLFEMVEKLPGRRCSMAGGVERYAIAIRKAGIRAGCLWRNSPRTRSRRSGQSSDCACRVARGDDVGLEIARRRGAICRMS